MNPFKAIARRMKNKDPDKITVAKVCAGGGDAWDKGVMTPVFVERSAQLVNTAGEIQMFCPRCLRKLRR